MLKADKCEKKHIWTEAKKTTTNKTREPIYKYYEIFSLKSIIHLNISRLDKNRIICSWIDWTWVVYSTLNFFLSANLSNWTANIDMISTRFLIFIKFTAFLKRKKNQKCLFLIFLSERIRINWTLSLKVLGERIREDFKDVSL